MQNPIYLLAKTNSDNEHDDISYAYITLEPGAVGALRELSSNFEAFKQTNGALFNVKFYCPASIDVRYLTGYHFDEGIDQLPGSRWKVLAAPISEDFLEDSEPEWRMDATFVYFCLTPRDFRFFGIYKHDSGGVWSPDFEIDDLAKLFSEANQN